MSDVRMSVDLLCSREQAWPAVSDGRIISTWLMPTDLQPVSGNACRFFPPPSTAGFAGPFDADVLEVTAPQRMVMLWRGEHLHTNVIWELTSTPSGCRLDVVQSGFLGLDGERRSQDLLSSYGYFFQQRLVAMLTPTFVGSASVPRPAPVPSPDRTWRLRMLSIAGAMVLTVLAASAMATWALSRPSTSPQVPMAAATPSARGPALALQPGVTPTTPSTRRVSLTAVYGVSEDFDGGYIGSIAIQASPSGMANWTATIELPADAEITSAWDQVSFERSGTWWIFTPLDTHRQLAAGQEFTFYFQVGGEAKPTACSVQGVPCSGLI